jgi:peptide subunit release factor 1 (eRF1)
MIQNNWRSLLSRSTRQSRSILSVYLSIDQSQQGNLNHGFENRFKHMMVQLRSNISDSAELDRFRRAEHHLAKFLPKHDPHGRTLVMFFDDADGFFWYEDVELPMPDGSRWDRELFLKPLAAAADDFALYGVALVGRAHARLFTIFLGGIEEVIQREFDPIKVRHIKTVGTDHWGSASQVQRKADEQVRRNLRQVVNDLDSLVESKNIDRLLLAGTHELTSELQNLLPKRLSIRVIGSLDLDAGSPREDVLDATLALTQNYERESEERIVKEVATSAAKSRNAVTGLANTLSRVNEARVWQLIYSEDFQSPGFECTKCGALFSIEKPACSHCGGTVTRVDDVVERAVERALRSDARIEIVRGEAASTLDNTGGIAAFLKTRTRTSGLQD